MAKRRHVSYRKARWLRVTTIMARDGVNCAICDGPLDRHLRVPGHALYITFDHIVPRSRGGSDRIENLRLAHHACNQARGNDPLIEEDDRG